jgi:hypothetical protein
VRQNPQISDKFAANCPQLDRDFLTGGRRDGTGFAILWGNPQHFAGETDDLEHRRGGPYDARGPIPFNPAVGLRSVK